MRNDPSLNLSLFTHSGEFTGTRTPAGVPSSSDACWENSSSRTEENALMGRRRPSDGEGKRDAHCVIYTHTDPMSVNGHTLLKA